MAKKRKLKNIRDFNIEETPSTKLGGKYETKMQREMDKKKKMMYKDGGMSKAEIMKKQKEYNKNNPDNTLVVDGIMGPKTRAAMKGKKKKKMMGGGMKKIYRSGGFIEPSIPNLDNI